MKTGITSSASASANLFQYIKNLPSSDAKLRLYADPTRGMFACRAVLQFLPDLARQMIFRLAALSGPFQFRREEVLSWTKPGSRQEAIAALQEMLVFCIILPTETEDLTSESSVKVQLTPEFHSGVKGCMTSVQATPWPSINIDTVLKKENQQLGVQKPPSLNELEIYTQKRWDSVLHFLVGSTEYEENPPGAVVHFLERTGLMQKDSDQGLVISSKGYEFMLQDVHLQVWLFILQYLSSLEVNKRCDDIRHEALLFLICLSYCRVGEPYPASMLSRDSQVLCKDFSQFGLVYLFNISNDPKNKDTLYFYPTRVAVNLIAGSGSRVAQIGTPSISSSRALGAALSASIPGTSHLAIIVQTNFQLCAYTTSELHVSMLSLFCDENSFRRLPNIVIFQITRDSVKSAFKLGIGAGQILQFLKMNAHPRLRNGGPLIPSNIEDQILLWDRERNRVQFDEVWMLQCSNGNEFDAIRQFAINIGAHAWSNEQKNSILIRYSFAEHVTSYVQKLRSKSSKKRRHVSVDG